MRKFLFLILVFSCKLSFAQTSSSKIVFVRPACSWLMDEPGNLRLFDHGKKITKLGRNDAAVCTISTDNSSLSYQLKKLKFGALASKVEISNTPNTVHFVIFRRKKNIFFVRFRAEEVNEQQFLNYYNSNKWLQRNLAKHGYHSLEELVKK